MRLTGFGKNKSAHGVICPAQLCFRPIFVFDSMPRFHHVNSSQLITLSKISGKTLDTLYLFHGIIHICIKAWMPKFIVALVAPI